MVKDLADHAVTGRATYARVVHPHCRPHLSSVNRAKTQWPAKAATHHTDTAVQLLRRRDGLLPQVIDGVFSRRCIH